MHRSRSLLALALALALPPAARAARVASQETLHKIDGRLVAGNRQPGNVRVRLVMRDGLRRVAETVTREDGRFLFANLGQGDYIVTVDETDEFHAVESVVEVRKMTIGPAESVGRNERPETQPGSTFFVTIHLTMKRRPGAAPATGTLAADVDVGVPEEARRRYEQAMALCGDGQAKRRISELREAVKAHPAYYAARLELGRELRREKKFAEARDALEPLRKIAPKRAEALVEIGIVLMGLGRREEAAATLRSALALEEANWSAHLYLGYALVDVADEEAEPHFWRALKLNGREAAGAHLALARLAHRYGYLREAVEQLEAYLAVAPDAPDAGEVRKLAASLRSKVRE